MNGWGIFFILLVVVVIFGSVGWIFFCRYRARQRGLPPPGLRDYNPFNRNRDAASYRPPAPAPGGIKDWVTDRWNAMRNKRTAGGAYESTGAGGSYGGSRGRRGFGALDPDEAWDARVGNEADYYGGYEEQELGLHDPGHGPYGGGGYGESHVGVGGIPEERGRSRDRQKEVDNRYDEEMHGGAPRQNPFGDNAESSNMSLRATSPRPADQERGHSRGISAHRRGQSSLNTNATDEDSPTERRSMFREEM